MNIQQRPTPNIYKLDQAPLTIVFHTTLGSFKGAVEWLTMSPEERERITGKKSSSSAHAVFGREGEVAKLAEVNVATWHAGVVYKPTQRAKSMLPKTIFGNLQNPNKATIGLEFAAGYDIDRDGILEGWEKLYSPVQIKNAAEYIITEIEPAMKKYHEIEIQFGNSNSCTHHDINVEKPNLEIQRAMVLAELLKQRAAKVVTPKPKTELPKSPIINETKIPAPIVKPATELILESGNRVVLEKKGDDKIIIRKV